MLESIKNKIYNKENKQTMIEFRETIVEDVNSAMLDALAIKNIIGRAKEGAKYSDKFVLDKLQNEEQHLNRCIEKLKKMNQKAPKTFKLSDIYRAYKIILKTYRSVRYIKEYIHNIKEDKLMYEIVKSSQCN